MQSVGIKKNKKKKLTPSPIVAVATWQERMATDLGQITGTAM